MLSSVVFFENQRIQQARASIQHKYVGVRHACGQHLQHMVLICSPSYLIYLAVLFFANAKSYQNIQLCMFPKYNTVVHLTTRAMQRAVISTSPSP